MSSNTEQLSNRLLLDQCMLEAFVKEAMRPNENEISPSRMNVVDRMNLPFESVRRLYLDDRVDVLPDWLHNVFAVEENPSSVGTGLLSAGDTLDSSAAAELDSVLSGVFAHDGRPVSTKIYRSVFHTAVESKNRDHETPDILNAVAEEMENMDKVFDESESELRSIIELSDNRLLLLPLARQVVKLFARLSNVRLSILANSRLPREYPDNLTACAAMDIFYNLLSTVSDAQKLQYDDSSSAAALNALKELAEHNEKVLNTSYRPSEFAVALVRKILEWRANVNSAKAEVTARENGSFTWFSREEFPASFTGIHLRMLDSELTDEEIESYLSAGFDVLLDALSDCVEDPQVLKVLISNGKDVRCRSVVDYINALDAIDYRAESCVFDYSVSADETVSSAMLDVSVVDADEPVEVYAGGEFMGEMPVGDNMETVNAQFSISPSKIKEQSSLSVSVRPRIDPACLADRVAGLSSAKLTIVSDKTMTLEGTGNASAGTNISPDYFGTQTIELDTVSIEDDVYSLVSATLDIGIIDVDEDIRVYLNGNLLGTMPQGGNLEPSVHQFSVNTNYINVNGEKNVLKIELPNDNRWALVQSATLNVNYDVMTKIGSVQKSEAKTYHDDIVYGSDLGPDYRGGDSVLMPGISVPSNHKIVKAGMRVTLYDADEQETIKLNGQRVSYTRNPEFDHVDGAGNKTWTYVTIGKLPESENGAFPANNTELNVNWLKNSNTLSVITSSSGRYVAIRRVELICDYDIVSSVSRQTSVSFSASAGDPSVPRHTTIAVTGLDGKIIQSASLEATIQTPSAGDMPYVIFNGANIGAPELTALSNNRSRFTMPVDNGLVAPSNILWIETQKENVRLAIAAARLTVVVKTQPEAKNYSWTNPDEFDGEVEYYRDAGEEAFALVVERIFQKVREHLGYEELDLVPYTDVDVGFRLLSDNAIASNQLDFRNVYDFDGYLDRIESSSVRLSGNLSENTERILSMIRDARDYPDRYSHMEEKWSLCPFRNEMYKENGEAWNCPFALDGDSSASSVLEMCGFGMGISAPGDVPVTCPVYASFFYDESSPPDESDAAKYLCSLFRIDDNGKLDYDEDSSLAVVPSGSRTDDSSSAAYVDYISEKHPPMKIAALAPIIDLCKDLYAVNEEIARTEPFARISAPWEDSSSAALLDQEKNEYGVFLDDEGNDFFSFEPVSVCRFTNFHAGNAYEDSSDTGFAYTPAQSAVSELVPVNRDMAVPGGAPLFYVFGREETSGGVVLPPVRGIDYLEAPVGNSEWIDSGVNISNTTAVVAYFAFTGGEDVFVGQDGDYAFKFGIDDGKWVAQIRRNVISTDITADSNMHRFELDAENTMFAVDGVEYYPEGSSSSVDLGDYGHSWPVFAVRDSDGEVSAVSGVRLYALRILDESAPVREFIPVKQGSRGCLYDFTTKELFFSEDANA